MAFVVVAERGGWEADIVIGSVQGARDKASCFSKRLCGSKHVRQTKEILS
jgi:hypothetical protein